MNRREFVRNAAAGAATGLGEPSADVVRRGIAQLTTPLVDGLSPAALNERYLADLKTAGVTAWHKSMREAPSYAGVYAFVDEHRDDVFVATTVREIAGARREGKVALILGAQSADFLVPSILGSNLLSSRTGHELRAYYQLGLRICGLCYQLTNLFGGGALDPRVGLTRWGRRLVEQMHSQGIILDVGGHTGEQTSLDAIAISQGVPVICSHSNVAALNPNARALSDRLIEAIASTGGVIGVSAISDFHVRSAKDADRPVSPRATLAAHLDQYDYLRRLVGADHVGLGPDFVGDATVLNNPPYSWTFPADLVSAGAMRYVEGVEGPLDLRKVLDGLRRRGWSAEELAMLAGENWLRVYERVWQG